MTEGHYKGRNPISNETWMAGGSSREGTYDGLDSFRSGRILEGREVFGKGGTLADISPLYVVSYKD